MSRKNLFKTALCKSWKGKDRQKIGYINKNCFHKKYFLFILKTMTKSLWWVISYESWSMSHKLWVKTIIYKKKLRVAFEPQMSASKIWNQNGSVLDFQKSIFQKIFNLRIEKWKREGVREKVENKKGSWDGPRSSLDGPGRPKFSRLKNRRLL